MSGRQTPRNGVLAQYFEFVTTMTSKDSNGIQQVCGAAALLVPLGFLGTASFVLLHRVEHVNVGVLLGVMGGGGICGLGLAVGRSIRRRLKVRRDADVVQLDAPARKKRREREPGGEGEETTRDDGDEPPDSSVGT